MSSQIMKSPKKLIINADDYGASVEVNAAIEELALARMLGGVSVLANGEHCDSALAFLRNNPKISAGIHLNLIEGLPTAHQAKVNSLLGIDGNFLNRGALLLRWAIHPFAISQAVEIEWRAQIERLLNAGIQITHADSHQHLHAFPLAFRIATKLCREYKIPALRIPQEVNQIADRKLTATALNANLFISNRITPKTALRHNDHFLGFKRAGGYGINEFLADLPNVREGITELALHPSTKNFFPYPTLRGNDEREAVLSHQFQLEIQRLNIALTNWADI